MGEGDRVELPECSLPPVEQVLAIDCLVDGDGWVPGHRPAFNVVGLLEVCDQRTELGHGRRCARQVGFQAIEVSQD